MLLPDDLTPDLLDPAAVEAAVADEAVADPIPGSAAGRAAAWEVTDAGAAEWALRRLALVEAAIDEAAGLAAGYRKAINDWEIARLRPLGRRREFWRAKLLAYARRRLTADEKSLPLVSGTLRSTWHKQARVVVTDEAGFVSWRQAEIVGEVARRVHHRLAALGEGVDVDRLAAEVVADVFDVVGAERLVRIKTEVAKSAVNETVQVVEKGDEGLVVLLDGEPVPGLAAEAPRTDYDVSVALPD